MTKMALPQFRTLQVRAHVLTHIFDLLSELQDFLPELMVETL